MIGVKKFASNYVRLSETDLVLNLLNSLGVGKTPQFLNPNLKIGPCQRAKKSKPHFRFHVIHALRRRVGGPRMPFFRINHSS